MIWEWTLRAGDWVRDYLFRVSSRFRNSLATMVQAACSGAGMVVFGGESPILMTFAAASGFFA